MKNLQNNPGISNLEVGFNEADIIASIEDVAEGHIKWIYDCLLARLGQQDALRLTQQDRKILKRRSFDIYISYLEGVTCKSRNSFS